MSRTIEANQRRAPVLGGILLIAGLFFLGALIWNQGRLAVFGKITEGVVTEVTTRVSYGSSPRKAGESMESLSQRSAPAVTHDLHLRFTPENGEPVDIVTVSTFGHSLKEGDGVKLIYLPGDPAHAEIYSARQLWLPMIVGSIVSTLCLWGGVFLRGKRKSRSS
ncbi:MAG: DUF3592 domain-containing protein [Verrucomicrobiae bacterium]|nr:DUF3592 domain-containing protein [Verrucomicrobiae bacterium]